MRAAISVPIDIDKGIDLARVARVMAQYKEPGELDYADAPPRVLDAIRAMKSAVAAGSIGNGTWGSELAPYKVVSDAFMDSLRNTGAFFRILDSMVKVPLRSQLVAFTANATGYVTGEGSAKRMTRSAFEREYVDAFRAVAFVVVSNELLKLGALADPLIANELRGAVSFTADEQFLTILDAGANTSASVGSTVNGVQQDLKVALAATDLGAQSRLFFIAHPDRVKLLATMTIDGGFAFADVNPVTGGTLLRTPLLPCDACASDAFYVVDASGLAGNADAIQVDNFRHATIQFDDAPDSPPTASTTVINLFQRGLTAIQASTYGGAKVVRSNSVYKLTGVDWGSANSP
ncbi:phage major capsid protein [Mesorhizobium sp. WSM4887]|uniref:phage major capsid protein n=1 Tax=Mesorhizobium sp. WSM4887 TaxID=3038543 RepID=UPI002416756A|nr:phage major capsid protein [Mesorhizobium sp. WSM4887]MDG4889280.1 phage major capsid protein [Mesorhizobium sp. WSM4887]